MKKQSRAQKITRWFTHFIELQLFLSLISLPLLIAWGLPISLLTPVANLIFNPVLTAFLFVSSLLFFTELVGIPNGLLVWCLDIITTWWTWVLDWYQNSWLIGFVKPSLWVLMLIPVLALIIIACKKIYSSRVTIIAMSLLFGILSVALYLQSRTASGVNGVAFNNDEVPILHYAQKTVVIDSGVIGKRASAVSWVNYTLVPELIKKTGRLVIDHLIVMQPSIRTFEALAALSVKVEIKNIYLPIWSGSMPRGIWRHYFALCERVKNGGGSVIRIGEYARTIKLSDEFIVYIQPLDTQLKYNEASFRAWSVYGQIDKLDFAFYAAKYTGKEVVTSKVKGVSDEEKVLLVVAQEGYQQVEYGEPKKILEAAGIDVVTASTLAGAAIAKDGSSTHVDIVLDKVNVSNYDGIFFIGGPGALEHLDNERSYRIIKDAAQAGIPFGAICVSPRILAKTGVLVNKRATGWNDDKELNALFRQYNVDYVPEDVVIDGNIVTAEGPHAAKKFGEAIVRVIKEEAESK